MKPACFTNYSAELAGPCTTCRHRGQCASRTELPAGLTILPLSRFPKREEALARFPGVSVSKADLEEKIASAGFYIKGNTVHNPSRRRICTVRAVGPFFICETPFHRDEVALLPQVVGCEVRHRIAKVPATAAISARLRKDGSLILCPSVEYACRAIIAAAYLKRLSHESRK